MKSEFLKFSSKRILFSTVVTSVLMAGSPLEVFAADATEVQAVMQTGTVTGQVVDANGEPVIGASILIKGTGTGIITDINGNFTVSASPDATLVVSFVGYKTQEISLSGKKNIKIILQEDSELLDEVVVVGYGTQKKATLTGAVASVSGDVLESRPVSNTAIGLQGQIPGLTITRTSARPGDEDMTIQLRGASSTNKVEPLVIIDGVPAISNTEFSSLNPNDIENVSVLKDASAAIYGARAAGGVILVTTKKGKKGDKLRISYNGMVTANTPANMIPLAGMRDFASTMAEASYQDFVESDGNGGEVITQRYVNGQTWNNVLAVGGKTPHAGVSFDDTNLLVIDKMALGDPFTYVDTNNLIHYYESNNWLDLLYGTTWSTQHNIGIQGSSERARWSASLGYADDRSVIIATDDGIKKYNARMNADYDIRGVL